MTAVLAARDLSVAFTGREGEVTAVDRVSFELMPGEVLGLVGESGSGKSTVGLAALGLHDPVRTRIGGSLTVCGTQVVGAPEARVRALRGDRISMVFQDALAALSPFHPVGEQVAEAYRLHHPAASRAEARERAGAMLERVGIPAARAREYPHLFSGGMRQRVMIAMALVNDPAVVVADEPTTALDVRVQRQVMDVLGELVADSGTAVLLVTHDVGVVAERADRMLVMRGGVLLEEGPTGKLLADAKHPYTRALIGAAPTMESVPGTRLATVDEPSPSAVPVRGAGPDAGAVLAEVKGLRVEFPVARRLFGRRPEPRVAVRDVSLRIAEGETLGLVGESGSGKSTTARVLAGLQRPTAGTVRVAGRDISGAADSASLRRELSREVQLVFQDPYASLNPRRTVEQIVTTPLTVHTSLDASERRERAAELLTQVGLSPDQLPRYPHEFSGGQRQRIGIARALAVRPKLIVADEPVSALDVSVQAQVLNLLMDLRDEFGLSLLFVSHDLAVVRHFCDHVAVMHQGEVVESGTREEVFGGPRHAYTRELLAGGIFSPSGV
ncbi:ABC transporter ATP-binding protein [Streptomyces sp. NBC_00237]|uniref:dipeptide ABC transporter ATP-binding protein n=1 Tax=Streptomyces sp. NBC_00237 TaxID=2975687 RepID=UPI0022543F0C|nr:ABC transporter ATP-binding protein [Streptomyces sp. NBC_00237]MCX5202181.1 ABC transporter ATP-binding protein [Streptomyces sp. NBC_00237]